MSATVSDTAAAGHTLTELVTMTSATLARVARDFSPAVFASSLAAEDMVLTDLILKANLPIGIFSLETGRLNQETLDVIGKVKAHYGYDIQLFYPDPAAVEQYVTQNGLNAFYDSVDMRRSCCGIRKVEPLGRALAGKQAWVTGQRRAQSSTRAELAVQELDTAHGMTKFNPLADWTEQNVWDYIRLNNVPYNALHDQGFPSIGCAPCTRAVQPGEDIRAGRWWWENPDSKECGLHLVDGKLIRIKSASLAD
jgi:phosphoadenosine phosphosulfate reductase